MQLDNRLELESKFAAKLSRLYGSHRRKIVAALKATGDPVDPKKIPASLWREIESETEQQLAEEVLIIYLLAFTSTAGQHDLDWDRKASQSLGEAYAGTRAKEIAAKMTANSRERLEAGGDPLEIFGPNRAATVARSEVGVAQAYGSMDSVKEFEPKPEPPESKRSTGKGDQEEGGDQKSPGKNRLPKDDQGGESDSGKQPPQEKPKRLTLVAYWRHSHIRPKGHAGAAVNPCKICTPMLNRPESQWNGLVPGSAHPNCILPGNQIRAFGKITAAAKSFYDGICIELRLDCGAVLTCTANHPILTPAGWKVANLIEKGSDIFRTADSEWPSSLVGPNANQIPTAIEEIFASIKVSSSMPACCVPASTKQFHGDGLFLKGEVEVVYSDSLLAHWYMPQIENQLMESILNSGTTRNHFLSGNCTSFARNFASRLSANSSMGSSGLLKSAFARHSAGAKQSGLTVRSDFSSGVDQVFPKWCPSNPKGICNGVFGFPRLITSYDGIGDGNLSILPTMLNANSAFGDPSSNHTDVDAERSRKFLSRFASMISTKQVFEVRRFHYSGHVYDLQVEGSHVYSASSISVSNCDCYPEFVALNDDSPPSAN